MVKRLFHACFASLTTALTVSGAETAFPYGNDETLILEHRFDEKGAWSLENMTIANGELSGDEGKFWQQAWLNLEAPLSLKEKSYAFYLAFRSDKSLSPEVSKVYYKLNISNDFSQKELPSITFNPRPNHLHFLYVDPGWQMEHTQELRFSEPDSLFPDTQTIERFRVIFEPQKDPFLKLTPQYWNRSTESWHSYGSAGNPVQLRASSKDLGELWSLHSIAIQLYKDVPIIDAVAISERNSVDR